jgi:hypothetical protein
MTTLKLVRVLSKRLCPNDTSVVLVEVKATRRLLEILVVGCGLLPLSCCIPAGVHACLSGVIHL